MKIAVITNEKLKTELLAPGLPEGTEIIWLTVPEAVEGAMAYMDLLFTPSPERIKQLSDLPSVPVFINSVESTLSGLPGHFFRFNGWNSFLQRNILEMAGPEGPARETAGQVCTALGRTPEWVPDIPGFISARVICTIINEAYFALGEKVSSKEDIDTAMKLGTNYPYGPFEWAGIIGLSRIFRLLDALGKTETRYQPASLLQKEALLS